MSDQERFDWDDDMDFESLADEQSTQDESFDESFEDLSSYEEDFDAASPEITTEAFDEEKSETKTLISGKNEGLGLSSGGWGLLFAVSTMVAGLGLAGAVVFISKTDPLSFWQPEGLTQVEQWFNFPTYPFNLLYILVGGVFSLAALGSWALARSIRGANARYRSVSRMYEQVIALRLDNEGDWQKSEFKSDPRSSAFVAETLGSWRLVMARQKKSLALEAELQTLQNALKSKSRDDLVGQYDHSLVAGLADSAVQLFDESEVARSEATNTRQKDKHESSEIIGVLQDARSWNRTTREKVGQQGVVVEKLASQLAELGTLVGKMQAGAEKPEVASAVDSITREVDAWSQQTQGQTELGKMNELVERGSKLAFQMAMEVARLGTRGERLLPMTQSLEELSNEFRQVTTGLSEDGNKHLSFLQNQLKQIKSQLSQGPGLLTGQVTEAVGKIIPSANAVSKNLVEVGQTFGQQSDRLVRLGESFSSFSGAEFKAEDINEGNPDNPPEGGLSLTQHDPFASKAPQTESVPDVDPFSQADNLLAGTDSSASGDSFITTTIPGEEENYQEPEPELPPVEEKVYDLSEFGAVPMQKPRTAGAEGEPSISKDSAADDAGKVFDLSEFGAVSLT